MNLFDALPIEDVALINNYINRYGGDGESASSYMDPERMSYFLRFWDKAKAPFYQAFGNMWMLMAMSGEGKDMNDILPFLVMNNATAGMDNNMLMFMALSNTKDGSKDMLPWLLMSQTMNAAPAHECKCGGNCSHASDKE